MKTDKRWIELFKQLSRFRIEGGAPLATWKFINVQAEFAVVGCQRVFPFQVARSINLRWCVGKKIDVVRLVCTSTNCQ